MTAPRRARFDAPTRLVVWVTLFAAGATAVVTIGASRGERARAASREFQTLVLGLGLGPALDISRCPPAFDPRVGASCPERTGPVPAGDAFSPDHAGAVLAP